MCPSGEIPKTPTDKDITIFACVALGCPHSICTSVHGSGWCSPLLQLWASVQQGPAGMLTMAASCYNAQRRYTNSCSHSAVGIPPLALSTMMPGTYQWRLLTKLSLVYNQPFLFTWFVLLYDVSSTLSTGAHPPSWTVMCRATFVNCPISVLVFILL